MNRNGKRKAGVGVGVCAALVAVVLVLAGPVAALGQCGPGGCGPGGRPTPGSPGMAPWQQAPPSRGGLFGGRRESPSGGKYTTPHPAVCRVFSSAGMGGTASLVCKGEDYGVLVTVSHIFKSTSDRVSATFSNKETLSGKVIALDKQIDLAFVQLSARPSSPILTIAGEHPEQGDPLTFAGYGSTNQYRVVSGVCRGYGGRSSVKGEFLLTVSGGARQGDSGGPILNARGELVGVLAATDGRETIGTYNGQVHVFSLSERYLFPWNADLAKEKYRPQQPPQITINPPMPPVPISPTAPVDPRLQGRVDVLERSVTALETTTGDHSKRVVELETIAEAAVTAAQNAETAAGKAFAEAVGAKEEIGQVAGDIGKVAASASDIGKTVADNIKETSRIAGLVGKASGLVEKVPVVGWTLGKIAMATGLPTAGVGFIAVIVVILIRRKVAPAIREDFREYRESGDPLMIQKLIDRLTDVVPGKWDDRIGDRVNQAVDHAMDRIGQGAPDPPPAAAAAAPTPSARRKKAA